jgi:gas vesicle protein
MMERQDNLDFLTAFAVGTVLGIGAALLLQPDRSPKARVLKQLKPYRKQMRKGYSQMKDGLRTGRGATAEMSGELVGAGRELLGEFRAEVAEILDDARSELRGLSKGAGRARRGMGM